MSSVIEKGLPAKPLVLLAIGNSKIEEWIQQFFMKQANIYVCSTDPGELMGKVSTLGPDILVIMRQNSMGGVPDAGVTAAGAAGLVQAVLFIVGELDEEGAEMFSQARESGVQHIVTCEKGGQIYGDELVYTLTGIIKDLDTNKGRETDPMEESIVGGEARKILNSLFANAGNLGKAIVQSAETVSVRNRVRRGKKPKIDRAEGISIDNSGGVQSVSSIDSTVIAPGGILSVVTPWRPGLAGRLAAQAVKMLAGVNAGEVSYIGACKNSTGALWLDVSEEELMMSDWRVPGSCSPILQGNVKIYAVDPIKDLQPVSEEELWMVVDSARKASTYTVVDLAGNMALAHRAARQGRMVLLVVVPGNDPVELRVTSIWTKNLADGNSNIVTGIDIRGVVPDIPAELNPRVIVRNNPADALSMALRMHKGNMFVWV